MKRSTECCCAKEMVSELRESASVCPATSNPCKCTSRGEPITVVLCFVARTTDDLALAQAIAGNNLLHSIDSEDRNGESVADLPGAPGAYSDPYDRCIHDLLQSSRNTSASARFGWKMFRRSFDGRTVRCIRTTGPSHGRSVSSCRQHGSGNQHRSTCSKFATRSMISDHAENAFRSTSAQTAYHDQLQSIV